MTYHPALEGLAHLERLRAPAGPRRGARRIAMEARRTYENELRCIDTPFGTYPRR